jgi:hypothetical protein
MTEITEPAELQGKKLVDPSGGEIGEVQEIYLDHETHRPEFAVVNTGLFGRKSTFVPLTGAALDGPRVWVDVDKGQVADAPTVDPEAELSPQQEAAIFSHYGISQSGPATSDAGEQGSPSADETADAGDGASGEAAGRPEGAPQTPSPESTPPSAPTDRGPTAETASPSAGTAPEAPGEGGTEAGLPRLRRYVVTEEVDVKVPVQREEIRVEPPEARRGEGGEQPK